MIEVAVSDLNHGERPFAVGVLARDMCGNPNPVAALGGDRLGRVRAMERLFRAMSATAPRAPLVARRGEWIVGVCGLSPPGTCQGSPAQGSRILPAMLRLGPARMSRLMRWNRAWSMRDPKERHWHLGPVAVEPGLQGMTVGSQMMERFCALMDTEGEMAYLETEKPENVRFYERFGFQVVDEADVLGAHNWFMRREAARS